MRISDWSSDVCSSDLDIYEQGKTQPDWFTALFRAGETGIIPAEELAAARRAMSEEQYAQEFECSFDAAIMGAYYGKLLAAAERDGRIGAMPWEPALPVHNAWDLGIGDSTELGRASWRERGCQYV